MPDETIPAIPASAPGIPPWAALGAQLLEALLQRLGPDGRAGPAGEPVVDRDPYVDRDPRPAPPRRTGARLERVCRVLTRRNEWVASALGACRCWGLSPGCSRCGGQGHPGALEVDPEAFEAVVLPLLRAQPELVARSLGGDVEAVPEQ